MNPQSFIGSFINDKVPSSVCIAADLEQCCERTKRTKSHPLLCPLSSSVTPRKLPSPWLPGFFRSAQRLDSTQPASRNCTKSRAAAPIEGQF